MSWKVTRSSKLEMQGFAQSNFITQLFVRKIQQSVLVYSENNTNRPWYLAEDKSIPIVSYEENNQLIET